MAKARPPLEYLADPEAFRFVDAPTPLAIPQRGGPPGVMEFGNIDLNARPVVNTPGGLATVRSLGVNIDGREVLLPTVSDDGRIMTEDEAIRQYEQTGRHLGKFDTPENSTAYARQLSKDQGVQYGGSDLPSVAQMGRQGVPTRLMEDDPRGLPPVPETDMMSEIWRTDPAAAERANKQDAAYWQFSPDADEMFRQMKAFSGLPALSDLVRPEVIAAVAAAKGSYGPVGFDRYLPGYRMSNRVEDRRGNPEDAAYALELDRDWRSSGAAPLMGRR